MSGVAGARQVRNHFVFAFGKLYTVKRGCLRLNTRLFMFDPNRRPGASRAIRLLFVGLGLLLILTGGYGLWWHYLTTTLKGELDHWVAEQVAAGWKITTGTVVVGGFPLHAVLTVPSPAVEDPSGNLWRGPPLAVIFSPFDPRYPHLEGPGRHVFTIKGRDPLSISAEGASADLRFDGQGLGDASIDLAAAAAGSVRVGRLTVQWHRLAAGRVEHTVASWGLRVLVENLALPDDPRLLFGSLLPSIRLETHLQGSLGGGSPVQALTAWRDDGGTLEIDSLSINWPPLILSGKGTLALDRDLQPILASDCNVRGLFEAVDALTRGGVVRARDAGMVKLVFGLMMKPGKDGEKTLNVPVTVQNRVLSIGPVKLFELPAVAWHESVTP